MQAGLEGVAQEIRQVCVRPPRSWGLGQAPHHQPVAGAGQDNPKHIVGFNTVLSSDQHQSPSRVANLSYKAGQISHLSARVCVGRVETGGTCCLLELPKHSLHFLPSSFSLWGQFLSTCKTGIPVDFPTAAHFRQRQLLGINSSFPSRSNHALWGPHIPGKLSLWVS